MLWAGFQVGARLDSLLIPFLYWTMIPTFPPIHRGCKSSRYDERDPFPHILANFPIHFFHSFIYVPVNKSLFHL